MRKVAFNLIDQRFTPILVEWYFEED